MAKCAYSFVYLDGEKNLVPLPGKELKSASLRQALKTGIEMARVLIEGFRASEGFVMMSWEGKPVKTIPIDRLQIYLIEKDLPAEEVEKELPGMDIIADFCEFVWPSDGPAKLPRNSQMRWDDVTVSFIQSMNGWLTTIEKGGKRVTVDFFDASVTTISTQLDISDIKAEIIWGELLGKVIVTKSQL